MLAILSQHKMQKKERQKSIIKISLQISSSKNVCMLVSFIHWIHVMLINYSIFFMCNFPKQEKNEI